MNTEHKKILIVEDDPSDAELVLAALEESDLAEQAALVADGEQAINYLQCRGRWCMRSDGLPHVVLLDLKMPRVSGLDVLCSMRSDTRLKLLPAVIFSSSAEPADIAQAYEFGANSYVVKPVDFAEFFDTVHLLARFWVRTNRVVRLPHDAADESPPAAFYLHTTAKDHENTTPYPASRR